MIQPGHTAFRGSISTGPVHGTDWTPVSCLPTGGCCTISGLGVFALAVSVSAASLFVLNKSLGDTGTADLRLVLRRVGGAAAMPRFCSPGRLDGMRGWWGLANWATKTRHDASALNRAGSRFATRMPARSSTWSRSRPNSRRDSPKNSRSKTGQTRETRGKLENVGAHSRSLTVAAPSSAMRGVPDAPKSHTTTRFRCPAPEAIILIARRIRGETDVAEVCASGSHPKTLQQPKKYASLPVLSGRRYLIHRNPRTGPRHWFWQ